jgi:hypothetical protein
MAAGAGGDHMHAQRMGVPGDIGADAAQAHHQKRAARHLSAALAEIGRVLLKATISLAFVNEARLEAATVWKAHDIAGLTKSVVRRRRFGKFG